MREYKKLLGDFYHLENRPLLVKSLSYDFFLTFFGVGSGLFFSVIRGVLFKIFLRCKFPTLIGRRFKIVNSYFFFCGKNVWIKDDVSLGLGGDLKIGDRCVFCERATIWTGKHGIKIGNDCAIGIGSFICGSGAMIEIGNDVRIADSVRMYTFNHNYETIGKSIAKQGNTLGEITIKDNVWIGSGAVILMGVTIGKNSVVGAGAVVTKNVPENSVVGGVPAKVIKKL
ncbi:MAG: acyltransferase [Patescibacteria group bacterium]